MCSAALYADLCVEGSLVTRCDGIYLFASFEEVDALEVPYTSPTRYAAKHNGQQLSSRVSACLYTSSSFWPLPSNVEEPSRTMDLVNLL